MPKLLARLNRYVIARAADMFDTTDDTFSAMRKNGQYHSRTIKSYMEDINAKVD